MPTLTATKPHPPSPCLGQSAILHMAYAGQDLGPLTNELVARALSPVADAGAVMDLATILQTRGGALAAEGARLLRQAATVQPNYRIIHGAGTGPRLLALVTPGDFMANTPVDFLLNGSDAVLILHYVDAQTMQLILPPHDVAFLAVAESDANAPVLANLTRLLATHCGPVLNNDPAGIARLTRDRVSALLGREPSLLAPRTQRLPRDKLTVANLPFPVTLRPVGSHAGQGLSLISHSGDLAMWLASNPAPEAFVAPFIQYRGVDGLYRKQRVVMINGEPFASHMATSTHWMVHYLNAEMANHPDRRMAEALWMADFDHSFARRHARAFAALHRLIGLDYFGIDCAEAPDGRLLVFEVDTAMIVHDMDDEGLFPYKSPAMRRLFDAFVQGVRTKAG